MDMKIEMEVDNSELIISEKDEAVIRALTTIGMLAEGYAKKALTDQKAVDTGRLRNSVSWAILDDSVYIGTNVEYAPYVELGTSKMAARPYLRPAVTDHVNKYKAVIRNEMKK